MRVRRDRSRAVETRRSGRTHGVTCPEGAGSSLLEAIAQTIAAHPEAEAGVGVGVGAGRGTDSFGGTL